MKEIVEKCLPPRGGSGFKPLWSGTSSYAHLVSLREEGVDLSLMIQQLTA